MLSHITVNSSRLKIDVRVFSWAFTGTTQKKEKKRLPVVTLQKGEVSGI